MTITKYAHPRAALVGNPSDGYNGKTIAFLFDNYEVRVDLSSSRDLEIIPSERDHSRFSSLTELVEDVRSFGYYGGVRMIKATLKRFYDYCRAHDIVLDDRNFTIRYHTSIPVRLGMAGSSAIIAATAKALFAFYGVSIALPFLPQFLLSVETDELAISAGLQDRVAQTYGGLVYMDFDKKHFDRQGHGVYERLDARMIQNVYIAFRGNLSEGSEILHNDMRGRFEAREKSIHRSVARWAALTTLFRDILIKTAVEFRIAEPGLREKDKLKYGAALHERLSPIINENYDIRRACLPINEANHDMVVSARSVGASAKFTGSGGAIVGTYLDTGMLNRLRGVLEKREIELLLPNVSDDGFGDKYD